MWAAQFYKYDKPRTWLSSAASGLWDTASLPRSALSWHSEQLVIDIAGDGSIQDEHPGTGNGRHQQAAGEGSHPE